MDLIAYLEAKLVQNDMDGTSVLYIPFGMEGTTTLSDALIAAYVRQYVLQAQASQNSIH
jgi:hypothetical protein